MQIVDANVAESSDAQEDDLDIHTRARRWLINRAQADSELASALRAMKERWGPYTERGRRYPLLRLFHELIDPAWDDLCSRRSALSQERTARAWNRYKKALFQSESEDRVIRGRARYPLLLSDIARAHGFDELTRFLEYLLPQLHGTDKWSVELLRDDVDACALKVADKQTVGGAMKINVEDIDSLCRFCGRKTELFSYLADETSLPKDDMKRHKRNRSRLSAIFCSEHRSNVPNSKSVSARYRTAKRNQERFLREFTYLDTQALCWDLGKPHAESRSELCDEFFFRLVRTTRLGVDYGAEDYGARAQAQARELVDRKISDRKKEIVALLASGYSQSSAAEQLGITRQAVSKALKSIPDNYRLDRACSD